MLCAFLWGHLSNVPMLVGFFVSSCARPSWVTTDPFSAPGLHAIVGKRSVLSLPDSNLCEALASL